MWDYCKWKFFKLHFSPGWVAQLLRVIPIRPGCRLAPPSGHVCRRINQWVRESVGPQHRCFSLSPSHSSFSLKLINKNRIKNKITSYIWNHWLRTVEAQPAFTPWYFTQHFSDASHLLSWFASSSFWVSAWTIPQSVESASFTSFFQIFAPLTSFLLLRAG